MLRAFSASQTDHQRFRDSRATRRPVQTVDNAAEFVDLALARFIALVDLVLAVVEHVAHD